MISSIYQYSYTESPSRHPSVSTQELEIINTPIQRSPSIDEIDDAIGVPFNQIIEGLYLGSEYGAGKILGKPSQEKSEEIKSSLKNNGIDTILCCTENSVHYFDGDFTYYDLPLVDTDNQPLDGYLERSFTIIDEGVRKGGILVHCAAGASRSASLVIYYLMRKYPQLSLDSIINFIKSKRPCVNPNPGFIAQLNNIRR